MLVVEHVRKYSCHNGKWARAEYASPKAAQHDRLEIFSYSHSHIEYAEAKHANEDWEFASLKLRKWTPDQGAKSIPKNIEGATKSGNFDADVELGCDRFSGNREDRRRKGTAETGICQDGADSQPETCQLVQSFYLRSATCLAGSRYLLPLEWPILGMQRIILPIKLNNILLSVWQIWWIWFSSSKLRQWLRLRP